MAFIEDLIGYIEDNSDLVFGTDLFITDHINNPAKCVIVSEFAGGTENWSGLKTQPVQILVMDLTYLTAQVLAETIYDLLANKAGFPDAALSHVFFCDVLNRSFPVGRNQRGSYVFSINFLFLTK